MNSAQDFFGLCYPQRYPKTEVASHHHSGLGSKALKRLVPVEGFEPPTTHLRSGRFGFFRPSRARSAISKNAASSFQWMRQNSRSPLVSANIAHIRASSVRIRKGKKRSVLT